MATQLAPSVLLDLGIYNGPWTPFTVNPLNPLVQGTAGNDDMTIVSVLNLTVNGMDGNDRIDASTQVAVANVFSGGNGSDQIFGNAGVNVINGDAGNDLIEGYGGSDTLNGGAGTDTLSYEHSNAGVNVNMTANGIGNMTVSGGHAAGDLVNAASFENLVGSNVTGALGTTQDTLTGNTRDNHIYGLHGNDTINGGAGNDFIDGGFGLDTIHGGAGNDVIYGGDWSGEGPFILDALNRLWGDAGSDRFVFKQVLDYELLSSVTIRDFNFAEGDRIDLSQVDAREDIAGDQAFGWGGQGGSPGSGHLNYVFTTTEDGPHVDLYGNTDADGTAEFHLRFDTVSGTPDPSWFIL